ncbi:DUF1015 domain-containing protein [Candidatus Ruminimicrobium bovinum]|uniref:DUF1015 domain-containing protein n=1 Tax=Candidatus Ruminimicrobium bovinum TaxID=3242779 RepID=UPI0039B86E4F
MAIIKGFNGIRYSKVNITNEICPPYDVISPEEKVKLKKNSKYNMVQLELSDACGKRNKYAQANFLFKQWLKDGVLKQEEKPSIYFYEQTFKDHGKKMTRRGFFAALKIENPHGGAVKAHEKTLAKPKADRLSLLKAVKANLSPIFLLFNDDKNKMVNLCKNISKKKATAVATDKEKTAHKLWAIDDEKIIKEVERTLKNKKTFIADGHHRYETAWNYLQYIKSKDKNFSDKKEYGYVLAYLCPMEDSGISIWPTHRVIEAPKNIEENIEKYFNVLPQKDFAKLQKAKIQPILLFKDNKYRTLVIKNENLLKKAMPKNCKAFRNLGVSILHNILIPKEQVAADKYIYVKDDKEAIALAKKTKKIAILVPATPVEAIKEIALNNENMPQKSTYFFPKLASGIIIHSV